VAEAISNHRNNRDNIRLRRLALLNYKKENINRHNIKIAETKNELEQAFSLIYQEYLKLGYIRETQPSKLHISLYNILPETSVFVLKSSPTVISTLTQIYDNEYFGLPMDAIYQEELNALRDKGRKLVEVSALVVSRESRWCNHFMYLLRVTLGYAISNNVDDICIMVNPKHVKFYKTILLFEELGREKYYPEVGASAVALRLNLDDIEDRMKDRYCSQDCDNNLHSFFYRPAGRAPGNDESSLKKKGTMDIDAVRYFFIEKTDMLKKMSSDKKDCIDSIYPELKKGKSLSTDFSIAIPLSEEPPPF